MMRHSEKKKKKIQKQRTPDHARNPEMSATTGVWIGEYSIKGMQ